MKIRTISYNDIEKLIQLFKRVAVQNTGFLVRTPEEYRSDYIEKLISDVQRSGVGLVVEHEDDKIDELIGVIYAFQKQPSCFHHVLTDLTIAVQPDAQSMGIGRRMFSHFIGHVEEATHFQRVELFTSAENSKGIKFYESLGFQIEGRFNKRIRHEDNEYQDDIAMAWLKADMRSLG